MAVADGTVAVVVARTAGTVIVRAAVAVHMFVIVVAHTAATAIVCVIATVPRSSPSFCSFLVCFHSPIFEAE